MRLSQSAAPTRHIAKCGSPLMLLAVLSCVGCDAGGVPANPQPSVIKPTGFVLDLPAGFEEKVPGKTFYHPKLRASISLAHEQGAVFRERAQEFTAETLREHSVALKERALRTVAGRDQLFVKGDRLNGEYPQLTAVVLFATGQGCAQLVAVYPSDLPEESQHMIDAAIQNAQYQD